MTIYGFKGWFIILLMTLVTALAKTRRVHDPMSDVPKLYEGDMALTMNQLEMLKEIQSPGNQMQDTVNAQTRGATTGQIWSEGGIIPYVINSRIGDAIHYMFHKRGQQLIKNAMKVWEHHVCVVFKQRGQERDYVEFVYKRGCWSYIGRIGGRQEISIGQFTEDPPCNEGALVHELGHLLGFFHEHNRPDRDKYVKINWENIRGGTEKNFRLQDRIDSKGVEYDMGSIMHYSKYAGNNRPGRVTIQPLDPQQDIGQLKGPSKLDIKQARILYKCDAEAEKAVAKKPGNQPPVPNRPENPWKRPRPPGRRPRRPLPRPGSRFPPRGRGGNRQGNRCIFRIIKHRRHRKIIKICRTNWPGNFLGHNNNTQTTGPKDAALMGKSSPSKVIPLEIYTRSVAEHITEIERIPGVEAIQDSHF